MIMDLMRFQCFVCICFTVFTADFVVRCFISDKTSRILFSNYVEKHEGKWLPFLFSCFKLHSGVLYTETKQSGYFLIMVLQHFYALDNSAFSGVYSAGVIPGDLPVGISILCFSFAIVRFSVENGQQYSGVILLWLSSFATQ